MVSGSRRRTERARGVPARITKLDYPIPVGTGMKGGPLHKTWAFMKQGTIRHQAVIEWQRAVREANQNVKKKRRKIERAAAEAQRLQLMRGMLTVRRGIATASAFFMKRISPRERAIRARLLEAGVPIERPIEILEKNKRHRGETALELFQRGEYKQLGEMARDHRNHFSESGWQTVVHNIGAMIVSMHGAGVVHNHLHFGNIVIHPNGALRLIDLSLARMNVPMPRSKKEFLRKFSLDLWTAAQSSSELLAPRDYTDNMLPYILRAIQSWLPMYERQMDTFGVTPADIFEHIVNEEEKRKKKRK